MTDIQPILAGDIRTAARLMRDLDDRRPDALAALKALFPHTGNAYMVGITGNPGAGKSTVVDALIAYYRAANDRVGVVCVDPTSPFSGGAILGDRIRMQRHAVDPGVFIRSVATRGHLGGLSRSARDMVRILDAWGADVVLVETVGVGQDELEVTRTAHTTLVVMAPGMGDEVQAIKAGILEIADVHVVSKCDRADANRTIAELKSMLAMGLPMAGGKDRWYPPVVPTSALENKGVDAVIDAVDAHRAALDRSGEITARRAQIAQRRLLRASEDILRDRFERQRHGALAQLLEQLAARRMSPHSAAVRLLEAIRIGGNA